MTAQCHIPVASSFHSNHCNNIKYQVVVVEKFYSGRNLEQIEVRKCLLSFGAESCVSQVAIQKLKD